MGEFQKSEEVSGSYLGPSALEFLDDKTLCVLQQDAWRLDIFCLEQQKVLRQMSLPGRPNDMLKVEVKKAEKTVTRIYISCGQLNGEVVEVDPVEMKILRRWKGMHTPTALAYIKRSDTLLIARRYHADVAFVDLHQDPAEAWENAPKVKVVREPLQMELSPDEKRLYVANFLPLMPSNEVIVAAEISIVDTMTRDVKNVVLPDGSNSVRDLCVSPDGKYVFLIHVQSEHRSITSQLSGGWTNRNGLTILDVENEDRTGCYLLDDSLQGAANPWSIRISSDGKLLAITFSGCREVGFIGVEELIARMTRDLQGLSAGYNVVWSAGTLQQTLKMVRCEELIGPRALVINEKYTVAAGYFSDNLVVFSRENMAAKEKVQKKERGIYGTCEHFTSFHPHIISLGEPPVLDAVRRGEIYFHDAELAQERWHSCATCHPEARVDGMNWDLLNDGVGNHKNTKSMLYSYQTPPCMVTGIRKNAFIATRAGFIHIHFMPQDESLYQDVDAYLQALTPTPGMALNPDGTLTESAKRGKRLFFSNRTGCSSCHYGKYFTDKKMHDVLSENEYDAYSDFDTPGLNEVFRTAPYLHDGRYTTLQELLFKGYHGDPEKRLDQLSEQDKQDLIEYILSL